MRPLGCSGFMPTRIESNRPAPDPFSSDRSGSVGRRAERSPGVTGAEEAVRATRTVAARDVVLRRTDLPRIEHWLDYAPRPCDLVEAEERRVIALQDVEQQLLV